MLGTIICALCFFIIPICTAVHNCYYKIDFAKIQSTLLFTLNTINFKFSFSYFCNSQKSDFFCEGGVII